MILLAVSLGGCQSSPSASAPIPPTLSPATLSEAQLLAVGAVVLDAANADGPGIESVGVNEERQVVWFSGPELTEGSTGAAALRELVRAEAGDAVSVEIEPYKEWEEIVTK